ncbi:uncharacterized protein EI97DRAFT_137238 [Westerdykella ornata]|uniref:Uncharacterized protein n=1 Tax=Westerdykella ornata TaxID=318751 RepID=A0A6A6JD14_WESOR|nr:uncharacterized protein EI97DRAFT_137238 [Westerdykella ornata]KAF2274157.1 hypothetical protein EI97DRAFT_137238 [Westerdykella ornata]
MPRASSSAPPTPLPFSIHLSISSTTKPFFFVCLLSFHFIRPSFPLQNHALLPFSILLRPLSPCSILPKLVVILPTTIPLLSSTTKRPCPNSPRPCTPTT